MMLEFESECCPLVHTVFLMMPPGPIQNLEASAEYSSSCRSDKNG